MKFIACVFLMMCTSLVFGQNKPQDIWYAKKFTAKSNAYPEALYFKKSQQFFIQKKWDSTLVYAMKQLHQKNNEELKDYCHFLRGYSFKNLKLFKQSLAEFNFTSKKFQSNPFVQHEFGQVFLELQKHKKAIVYFKSLEKLKPNNQFSISIGSLYNDIGICYFLLKDLKKAEIYYFKSLSLLEKENDAGQLYKINTNIANLYFEQFKDKQALEYFEKAYKLAKKTKAYNIKEDAAFNMATVEEIKSNFKKALAYRKEHEQWKDSLHNQNKIWALADLEKKFAVKEKQKQVNLLEAKNAIHRAERNTLLWSSGLLLALLGTGIYFYLQKVKTNRIISKQKAVLDDLNATKDKLFSIVSHDLRSSVSALKSSNKKLQQSLDSKNYEILDSQLNTNSAIANGAYNLLDNLLNWALLQTEQSFFYQEKTHLYSISKQVAFNYEPLMVHKSISFKIQIPSSVFIYVDTDSFKIILRNLLDNAIKFCPENGQVSLYTQTTDDGFTHIVVKDTGSGMTETKRKELLAPTVLLSKKGKEEGIGTGLGMQLCKSLIAKNGGRLNIETKLNQGTKMIVVMPLSKN